jgi:general secretion pathway protein I
LAQWCVENELVNVKLARTFPSPGDTDFKCAQLGRDLPGVMHAKAVPANPDFRQVEVQVFDENKQGILRLVTVVPRH